MATPIKSIESGSNRNLQGGKTRCARDAGSNAISERIIDAFYEMGSIQAGGQAVCHRLSSKSPHTSWAPHGFNASTAACVLSAPARCSQTRSSLRFA